MRGSGKFQNEQGRGELKLFATVFLLFLMGSLLPAVARGASPEILRVRHFSGPDHTRIVLDLDRPGSLEVRRVADPERIAINVRRAAFNSTWPIGVNDGLVRRIRRNSGRTRAQVVIDLEKEARFESFSLPAASGRPHRIVIDVFRGSKIRTQVRTTIAKQVGKPALAPFTIVIDPGHGGLDPGAVRGGLKEKDVVLEVALAMAKRINVLPGYRAVLTRKTDYYPSLGRRVRLAREKDGDLFLSIHCNVHPRRSSVAGMEVYFLSLQGATDRQAQELADKENAADLVGLDPQTNHDSSVVKILMDLRMSQLLHESSRLADHLLAAADCSGIVQGRKAKQARFQVLRTLAMPAALVEIGYLTNQHDLDLLKTTAARENIADLLVQGVLTWRSDKTAIASLHPERTESWTRRYQVRSGDNLWRLARKHQTTITEIARQNNLNSQSLMIGQILRLPEVYQKQ